MEDIFNHGLKEGLVYDMPVQDSTCDATVTDATKQLLIIRIRSLEMLKKEEKFKFHGNLTRKYECECCAA